MNDVRASAARVLLALVETGHTTLSAELERVRGDLSDRRDRALLLELTSGTLRWRNEIDAVIYAASSRPIRRIQPVPLAVLRLGAYQLLHLDRVPAHAILHESVAVVRSLGARRADRFVNAVLRAITRGDGTSGLPARPASAAGDAAVSYLSTTLSHPVWLVERWLARLGFEEAEQWCRYNNESPELTVRGIGDVDPSALLDEVRKAIPDARPAIYMAGAIRLPPGSLGQLDEQLRGRLMVQDEAAQLVATLANAQSGERVLDVCAAPGGKTLILASDMRRAGGAPAFRIVAGDHRRARIRLLAETLARAGVAASVVALDADGGLPFGEALDCVLLDVPCTGLGTLRRDPDLKWSRTLADVKAAQGTQIRMLRAAAGTVRPGGRVIYATCSSEPEENQGVVEAFLAEDRRFARVDGRLSGRLSPDLFTAEGDLETSPARHGLDAFFGAILVRLAAT